MSEFRAAVAEGFSLDALLERMAEKVAARLQNGDQGDRTESVYRRYDIVSKRDLLNAAEKLERYLENEHWSAQETNAKPKLTEPTEYGHA